MLAWYMVLFQASVVGVEHFRKICIGICVCPESALQLDDHAIWRSELDGSVYFDTYVEGPRPPNLHVGGSPVRLSNWMVDKLRSYADHERLFVAISVNTPDWATAATILWSRALAPAMHDTLLAGGWFNVPCDQWRAEFKPLLEVVRRSGMFGMVRSEVVWQVRKVLNLTYRSMDDADWKGELFRRGAWAVEKRIPYQGLSGTAAWYDCLVRSLERYCGELVARVADAQESRLETLQEWWQARHHWCPNGSSGIRRVVEKDLRHDDRWRAGDRAKKKAVVEALDDDYVEQVLYNGLPCYLSRGSTKPEPGGKQRALIAAHDGVFFLSAYASVHMEKAMSFNGVYGKQMPVDVVEWVKASKYLKGYWSSLDFSDFNIEHEKWALSLVNIKMAQAWLEKAPSDVAKQKAASALWLAEAQSMSWIKVEGVWHRITNGLDSGSRDTLRDNNILHRAYCDGGMLAVSGLGYDVEPLYEGFVGDDEDRCDQSLMSAIAYGWGMRFCGHLINPAKQMGGRQHHEFLQRIADGENLPKRPLAMILATMASGNWYVEQGVWFDSAVQSVSDNWWECVTRGLPLIDAQKLAAMYLDAIMVVKPTQEGDGVYEKEKKLEWWKFRHAGADHPLWRGTPGVSVQGPLMPSKPLPHRSWPSKATDAWMERVKPLLLKLRPGRREAYKRYLLMESIGPSYHHYRQRELRDQVRELWPVRVSRPRKFWQSREIRAVGLDEFVDIGGTLELERKPFDNEAMLAACGIDVYLAKQLGATVSIVSLMKPAQYMNFCTPVEKMPIAAKFEVLDSGLRAWVNQIPHYSSYWHQVEKPRFIKPHDELVFVLAGAGSGKSFIAKHNRKYIDMDIAVYARVGWRKWRSEETDPFGDYMREGHALIDACMEENKTWILGQWPARSLVDAAKSRGIKIKVLIYDPGELTRLNRLRERQGWDLGKVSEYLARFRRAVRSWEKAVARGMASVYTGIEVIGSPKGNEDIRIVEDASKLLDSY